MRFIRLKRLARTLRFRLMLWNALAALATAAAALIGMQIGVRQALQHELDQFLVDDLQTIGDALSEVPPPNGQSPLAELKSWYRHPRHGRFVAVYDRDDHRLWETIDHPPPTLDIDSPADEMPFYAGDYRVIQKSIRDASGKQLIVRTGIPLAALRDEVARVDMLALIVTACIVPISLVIGWMLAGRVTKVLGTLTDRAAQLRPARLDERLPVRGTDDELDHLAIEFNTLLDRLAAELDRREDVLANAAHELRTPVAAIRGGAEVTLASHRTADEYENVLTDVIEECESLEELIRRLLLLSESEADRLRIQGERVALADLVGKAASRFAPAAESGGVTLRSRVIPAEVEGSANHLRQVFNNLLDNALKHVSPGGHIDVAMAIRPERDQVEITVQDDGVGIAVSDQPRIFERFFRCESSRRGEKATKGFGLGLAICKTVIDSHGGTIVVESEPGHGTTFQITLPLARPTRTHDTSVAEI